jgi:hypothetical protein
MAIDRLGEPEFDQEAQEQGDVIDALVSQFQGGGGDDADLRCRGRGEIDEAFAGAICGAGPGWRAW